MKELKRKQKMQNSYGRHQYRPSRLQAPGFEFKADKTDFWWKKTAKCSEKDRETNGHLL